MVARASEAGIADAGEAIPAAEEAGAEATTVVAAEEDVTGRATMDTVHKPLAIAAQCRSRCHRRPPQ